MRTTTMYLDALKRIRGNNYIIMLLTLILLQGFFSFNDSVTLYFANAYEMRQNIPFQNRIRYHQVHVPAFGCRFSKSQQTRKSTLSTIDRRDNIRGNQRRIVSLESISTSKSASRSRRLFTTTSNEFDTVVSSTDLSTNNDVTLSSFDANTIDLKSQVLERLKNIIDPDLNADIVTLGFVQGLIISQNDNTKDKYDVSFDVELTTPACPVKEQFKNDCISYVSQLPWVNNVDVTMTSQIPKASIATDVVGMSKIGSIIAVSSCKGGVGKSTTAVNLAFTLAKQGASVGIFDTDLYGPSLPTMVKVDDDIVRFIGRQIAPLVASSHPNVKLMSFGFINDDEQAAVMRGPMITQLLDQFMSIIYWGSLDYLIIDMPPGTGDIQLTLTQRLNITAAVIVTTPTELSYTDVVRGINMFNSVNVPCIAVVENMAYFEVPNTESRSLEPSTSTLLDDSILRNAIKQKLVQRQSVLSIMENETDSLADELVQIVLQQQQQQEQHKILEIQQGNDKIIDDNKSIQRLQIFGKGHKHRLSDQYGIEHTFSMPLLQRIASNGDSGIPYVIEYPDSPESQIYKQLTDSVVTEIAKIKYSNSSKYIQTPSIQYDKGDHIISVTFNEYQNQEMKHQQVMMSTATLRRNCRCALCVEEFTGRQLLIPSTISESIYPLRMYPTGNYALSVDWSDGHRSLYPYKQIRAITDDLISSQEKNS